MVLVKGYRRGDGTKVKPHYRRIRIIKSPLAGRRPNKADDAVLSRHLEAGWDIVDQETTKNDVITTFAHTEPEK